MLNIGAKVDNKSKQNDEEEGFAMEVPQGLPVDEHIEEVSENGRRVQKKGVYLLPNLVTTGALFGGFYAIVAAMNGDFAHAALAIFGAQILDGFDGRVARMTNTESAFGTEYDSLSDMVSFGLAPAMVVFSWALAPLGKFGWAAAFLYITCAALRLARFNTQKATSDANYFGGLASPPAATLMASGVWLGSDLDVTRDVSILAAIITAFVGLMMVSNIRYLSFKGLDGNRRVPFVAMLIVVLVLIAVLINSRVLFLLAFTYALSGPCLWLWKRLNIEAARGRTTNKTGGDGHSG